MIGIPNQFQYFDDIDHVGIFISNSFLLVVSTRNQDFWYPYLQGRTQEGLDPLRKNLSRALATVQIFWRGSRPFWVRPCVSCIRISLDQLKSASDLCFLSR